ncbi:MAG: amidohydrolase [Solobacterium sp.]|nr:amidohydrolase [Solobacterium sp.]
MNIHELASKYEDYTIALRRHFHMYPELGLQEEKTSARIQEELKEMGIPFDVVGHRNVVGRIEGGKPGKKLAIRADMDALPMQEEIESEYKSTVPGVMHACGHDAHTATLLGAAKCLMEMREELAGTVYLCFQVAEEISGNGPQEIVEYLSSKGGVDRIIGNHVAAPLPTGYAAVLKGAQFAGNCQWKLTVTGRGGHGSRPDQAIDPIRPAAMILNQITMIPSSYFDPFRTLVISPCMIHAGTAYNIIPDTCTIEGNLRYFHLEDLDTVLAKMEEIAEHTAAAFGASAKMEKIAYCPPVVNDDDAVDMAREVMAEIGTTYYPMPTPNTGSDDFSYMTAAYPGCYVQFGCKPDRPDAIPAHHNTRFFLDEKGFLPVVEFFVTYAAKYLK